MKGKWDLKMDRNVAYDISVTVKNKERSATFTQRIERVNQDVPLVAIR